MNIRLQRLLSGRGEELSVKPEEVTEFEALPGNGLHAVSNGKLLLGGSLRFLSEQTGVSKELRKQAEAACRAGKNTAVVCTGRENARDHCCCGYHEGRQPESHSGITKAWESM